MKILLATLGSRGDVEPFLWLARATEEGGHQVRVAVPDDADVDLADLDAVSLGVSFTDLSDSLRVKGESALRSFRERIRPAMSRALATAVNVALQWQPDVIVAHPKLLTVPVVAERLGIPYLLVELTPTLTPTREFPAAGIAHRSLGPIGNRLSYRVVGLAGSMFRTDVDAARDRLGMRRRAPLPPPAGSLVAISPTLLPRPADWPATTHLTGHWNGPARHDPIESEVRDFLEAETPFLYAGLGSMTGGDAEARAEAIIDGARLAGVRVLMATGWGGLEPPHRSLAPDVLVTRSVPHNAVLAHAVAALHQGGAGTVHATTRAGVPSIVVPFLGDQPFWAAQLGRLGLAGPPLHKDRLTPTVVRDAIAASVDRAPRARMAADSMAEENGTASALSIIITVG